MEYYENGGGAVARLHYTQVGDRPAETAYHAEYWNTPDATGLPSMPTGPPTSSATTRRSTSTGARARRATGIAADRFVARWTKTVTLSAGVYRFSGGRDDGMRAYVDNVPVVDKWTSATPSTASTRS